MLEFILWVLVLILSILFWNYLLGLAKRAIKALEASQLLLQALYDAMPETSKEQARLIRDKRLEK
jgi:hypothetical protein